MTLEIIGVGYGRTGTESMKTALEMLGFGPCHHMYEVLADKTRFDTWYAILRGTAEPDWPALLAGYRATVDWPLALYWRDLAALFPRAKLLLTLRPADDWYASMDRTILTLMRDPETHKMADALAKRVFPHGLDRDAVLRAYHDNTAALQAAFGPDRLLTYDLGSGWEPLCTFLNLSVPDAPFPSANQASGFHARDAALTDRRATTAPDTPRGDE